MNAAPFDLTGLPFVLALRLVTTAVTLLTASRPGVARRVAFLGSAVASLVTGIVAARALVAVSPVQGVLLVHQASGFSLRYAIDGLSAWFLLVLSVLAVPIALYSLGYIATSHWSRRSVAIGATFNLLIGAVEVVFVAADVVTFLAAWELMTLTTAALVATEHENRASRRAAYLYLTMSHLGTGFLIAGFLILASLSGSFSFAAVLSGDRAIGPIRHVLFTCFFIGFGVKAGVVPLHVWLPQAHPAAPTSISALMSAVLIKTGIYGMVRVCAFGLGVPRLSWGVIVLLVGGLSAVLGVLYALVQHDLKRLLAYHSIENVGIILLGLGAAMIGLSYGRSDVAALGLAASLYHVLNHAVFKGLLFLGAGGVVTATGTRQIERLGGLLRRMPWTGLCFLVGALAISGLPPLNGFASEWLTFQAFLFGFDGTTEPLVHLLFSMAGALLALTTALAAACFVKAFGMVFVALPRSRPAADAMESSSVMLAPQVWLAVCCVGLGLFPGLVVRVLGAVMISLPGLGSPDLVQGRLGMASGLVSFDRVIPAALGIALVAGWAIARSLTPHHAASRRVPTWGCGGRLTERTEYTATAFSKPLMMIFSSVYRPTRQVEALGDVSPYFPQEVRYRSEIEPTFERHVYGPILHAVLRVANGMRVLQAGSLHAYLAYVIALVVSLVLYVWWTS
ncbi:MAG TPA: proton-conducting transporter membrane subunit [Patescibacteria group bacterium]|nr:proton-conducting transporter membrane subunit [Patescibacteria group bacterium]